MNILKCECGLIGYSTEDAAKKGIHYYATAKAKPFMAMVPCPLAKGGKIYHLYDKTGWNEASYIKGIYSGSHLKNFNKWSEAHNKSEIKITSKVGQHSKNICENKIPYVNQIVAIDALNHLIDIGRDEKFAYHCRHCDRWHLSSRLPNEYKTIKSMSQSSGNPVSVERCYNDGKFVGLAISKICKDDGKIKRHFVGKDIFKEFLDSIIEATLHEDELNGDAN